MEVILTQDVTNVGVKGQLVKVKKGFFRNFLSTKGLAVTATPKLVEEARALTEKLEADAAEAARAAENVRRDLEGKTLHIKEKLTEKGTLYAKVSKKEVAEALKAQFGVELEEDAVHLNKAIKKVGDYDVKVTLAPTVATTIKVTIEGEE